MITTRIHAFNLSRDGYHKLLESLGDIPNVGQVWTAKEAFYDFGAKWNGQELTIEEDFLFREQWNVKLPDGTGHRVFDMVIDSSRRAGTYKGYYLEQTPEMVAIRANRVACGFCGKQESGAEKAGSIHLGCLGSKHLKESEFLQGFNRLYLVNERFKLVPLNAHEQETFLPMYAAEQLKSKRENLQRLLDENKRLLAKAKEDYDLKIKRAETEYAGTVFLLNAGISTDNVIYYPHSDAFRFGWIKSVSEDELTEFVEKIELHGNFPGVLEAKMNTGDIRTVYAWRELK